jgi:hypothetical protein
MNPEGTFLVPLGHKIYHQGAFLGLLGTIELIRRSLRCTGAPNESLRRLLVPLGCKIYYKGAFLVQLKRNCINNALHEIYWGAKRITKAPF